MTVFKKDLLFQYVLSYISKYTGKFGSNWNDAVYGHHIAKNKHFDWLCDYCQENDLLLFAGMCDDVCHSVSDVRVTYFDESGVEHEVDIPDFDDLFDTIEEAQEEMNKEYNRYYESLCTDN